MFEFKPKFFKIAVVLGFLPGAICLADPDCEKMFGQMIMVSMPPEPSAKVGGVTIMRPDLVEIESMEGVLELTQKLQAGRKTPLLIAIDQEGGLVARINAVKGFSKIPSPAAIGATNDPKLAYEFGRITSEELAAVGINVNFGSVADVNTNPNNPVIGKLKRSYSDDPHVVSQFVCENVRSHQEAGVLPVLKHFPGHGDTKTDSHSDFAVVEKTKAEMQQTELVPYNDILNRKCLNTVDSTKNMAIMMGHLILPNALKDKEKNVPSSLSQEVVSGWLRKDLGFKGLIFTDDLSMSGVTKYQSNRNLLAIQAIMAGNDVLTFATLRQIFSSTKEEDDLIQDVCKVARTSPDLMSRIKESSERIAIVKSSQKFIQADHIPKISSIELKANHRITLEKLGFDLVRMIVPKIPKTEPLDSSK